MRLIDGFCDERVPAINLTDGTSEARPLRKVAHRTAAASRAGNVWDKSVLRAIPVGHVTKPRLTCQLNRRFNNAQRRPSTIRSRSTIESELQAGLAGRLSSITRSPECPL